MPGFRPRNGCFPGRFRPGLSGGPAWFLHPSPGGRFSALRGGSGAVLRRFMSGDFAVPSGDFAVLSGLRCRPGCSGFSLRESFGRGPIGGVPFGRELPGAFPLFPPSLPCPGRFAGPWSMSRVAGQGDGSLAAFRSRECPHLAPGGGVSPVNPRVGRAAGWRHCASEAVFRPFGTGDVIVRLEARVTALRRSTTSLTKCPAVW